MRLGQSILIPQVGTWHDLGCTIFLCERRDCPYRAEQGLYTARQITTPYAAVAMENLSTLTRRYGHSRGEVQLNIVTELRQILACGSKHQWIYGNVLAGLRARNECANTLRFIAGELVTSVNFFG